MQLADWLEKTGTTQEAFGREVGVTQGRVSQIVQGARPSMKLLVRIMKATKGAVAFKDFVEAR